jgi:hypothetical protein
VILPDVNILLYAARGDLPGHARSRAWLQGALNGNEPVALVAPVLASFVRVATNRRVFATPTPLADAIGFVEAMLGAPAAFTPALPEGCAAELLRQCRAADARGDLVTDAYLAAVATSLGAELVSADRDFARFPGLRWRLPFS